MQSTTRAASVDVSPVQTRGGLNANSLNDINTLKIYKAAIEHEITNSSRKHRAFLIIYHHWPLAPLPDERPPLEEDFLEEDFLEEDRLLRFFCSRGTVIVCVFS